MYVYIHHFLSCQIMCAFIPKFLWLLVRPWHIGYLLPFLFVVVVIFYLSNAWPFFLLFLWCFPIFYNKFPYFFALCNSKAVPSNPLLFCYKRSPLVVYLLFLISWVYQELVNDAIEWEDLLPIPQLHLSLKNLFLDFIFINIRIGAKTVCTGNQKIWVLHVYNNIEL